MNSAKASKVSSDRDPRVRRSHRARRPSVTCVGAPAASPSSPDPHAARHGRACPCRSATVPQCSEMQVLAALLIAGFIAGARAAIRTPLEAFRPSGETHVRRPEKLPLLPHKRTAQPKSGLKILYQTGVSIAILLLPQVDKKIKFLYSYQNSQRRRLEFVS